MSTYPGTPDSKPSPQVEGFERKPNPFSDTMSGYGHIVNGQFESAYPQHSEMRDFHLSAQRYVSDYVLDKNVSIAAGDRRFPCVFGQAAFRTEQYAFSAYDDISDPVVVEGLLHDIVRAQHEFDIPASPPRTRRMFRTSLVAFRNPVIQNEMHGAEVLYRLLGDMHDRNSQHYDWPAGYSNDTESYNFGFGAGDTAHFIAYFHPHASVPARKSAVQFIVFNSHDVVYEYKDAKGMEDHARKKAEIRSRQVQPIHPYLGDHGVAPDWLQYALLPPDPAVEAHERLLRRAILGECPFQPPDKVIEPEQG
jgi:FPC/CPF motif-containing protein YcgG